MLHPQLFNTQAPEQIKKIIATKQDSLQYTSEMMKNGVVFLRHKFANNWCRGYKTLFMLKSTEQAISVAHKNKNGEISCFKMLRCCV